MNILYLYVYRICGMNKINPHVWFSHDILMSMRETNGVNR